MSRGRSMSRGRGGQMGRRSRANITRQFYKSQVGRGRHHHGRHRRPYYRGYRRRRAYNPYYYGYAYPSSYYYPYNYYYYGGAYYPYNYSYYYYTPETYVEGVAAIEANANEAQAPFSDDVAMNEVRVSTDPNINAQQWAASPNAVVHRGSAGAAPTFLYCTSGRPMLVPKSAATAELPVLAIDGDYYQCRV